MEAGGDEEGATAAAYVQKMPMPAQRIGGQDLGRDEALADRHEGGIAVGRRRALARALGIGPVIGERRLRQLAPEQGHGISQIVIEQAVMLDHGDDAGIVDQRRAERAQAVERTPRGVLSARPQQLERGRRRQQALRRRLGHLQLEREGGRRAGAGD